MYSHPAAAALQSQPAAPAFVRARVHALAPGTWPADPEPLTLSAEDIAAIAAAYDPVRYQAPVVIGHPDTDDPAWGWVIGASADERGLWLDLELLPEMAELVRARHYQAVSVSLWRPDAPGNPSPGVWAIKHLGYLGAAAPAVKGLAPTRLDAAQAAAPAVTITFTEAASAARSQKETRMSTTDQTVQLAEREKALAERERQLAARERELRRTAYAQELEPHIAAGRILPAERPELVALMERLESAPAVTLAEGAERPALEVLRGFLARLPARVDLKERAAGASAPATPPPAVPAGYRLSERGLELHTRALQYRAAHPGTDYISAVRAVERLTH